MRFQGQILPPPSFCSISSSLALFPSRLSPCGGKWLLAVPGLLSLCFKSNSREKASPSQQSQRRSPVPIPEQITISSPSPLSSLCSSGKSHRLGVGKAVVLGRRIGVWLAEAGGVGAVGRGKLHGYFPWPPWGQACQQSGERKPAWKQLRTLSMWVRSRA